MGFEGVEGGGGGGGGGGWGQKILRIDVNFH